LNGAAGLAVAPPPVAREEERRRDLRAMQRRATGLLVAVAAGYAAALVWGSDHGFGAYVRAFTQAAMVGGLADWFAVTALFRHPLGVPIPHTAVIRARKEQFGETLGAFVQENFLSPDVLGVRVRAAEPGRRLGEWLADPANAAALARHVADLAVQVADVVRDDDVHAALEEQIRRFVDAVPVAPLAGRALATLTEDGRHQELLEAVLRGSARFLEDNRIALHARFSEAAPWWLPGAVEDRIFDRLLDGVTALVEAVLADPQHELRAQFDTRMRELAVQLETSPEWRARGEQLKQDLLSQPQLRALSRSLWAQAKTALRAQAADPDSELRRRLAELLVAAGERVRTDPALAAKVDDVLDLAARYVAEHFRDELAGLVSGTIARWDGQETSDRLELLLGRDLQFIRINGTVVGGLAGVAIHALSGPLS
jgi:uncharacterized membrane-anchored protein YjiN (DUF445 family)